MVSSWQGVGVVERNIFLSVLLGGEMKAKRASFVLLVSSLFLREGYFLITDEF